MIDFIEKFFIAAASNPGQKAFISGESSISYDELYKQACFYSKLLEKQNSSPVLIYCQKKVSDFIAIWACIIAKRTYVPVSVGTPFERIKKIYDLSKASLIISDINLSESSDLFKNTECLPLEGLNKFSENPAVSYTNDTVYIIFTSGSTGEPKGVPISASNLNNFINWISVLGPLDGYKNARVFNQAAFSFDLSVADIFYSMCNGHTLVAGNIFSDSVVSDIFNVFEKEKIEIAVMTPTFMKLCLLNTDFTAEKLPDFKCVYFCGEILENKTVKSLFERFPKLQVINAYGPTEATSAVSGIVITPETADTEDVLPVGDATSSAVDIVIENDEIVLKGKSVFNGYLCGIKGGFYTENGINCYRTGDLGYYFNGRLYCKGRKDSQIKYKGYRIELTDIENNIKTVSGVKDCVVTAGYFGKIVKSIHAFVLVEKNTTIEYIKQELGKKLPDYMIPKTFRILASFPVNANGKTDRKALEAM